MKRTAIKWLFILLLFPFTLRSEKLTIFDCMNESLKNNADIKNAVINYKQNNLDQIKTLSMYLPNIGATYMKNHINEPSDLNPFGTYPMDINTFTPYVSMMIPGGGIVKAEYNNQSSTSPVTIIPISSSFSIPFGGPSYTKKLSFSIVQPLLQNIIFGPSDINILRMAGSSKNISKYAINQASETISFAAYNYFILVMINDLAITVKSNSLQRARDLFRKNMETKKLGIQEDTDILGSRAAISARTADLMNTRNQRKESMKNLELIMGVNKEFEIDNSVFLQSKTDPTNFVLQDEIDEALSGRFEIKIIEESIKIQKLFIKNTKSKLFPQLNFIGSYSIYGNSASDETSSRIMNSAAYKSWSIGLNVTMPIFPLSAYEETKKQDLELQKMTNNLQKTKLQIKNQIESAINNLITYQASMNEAINATAFQREKLQKEMQKFNIGRSANKTIIQYMDELQNSETMELQMRLQYYISYASLQYLKGKLISTCDLSCAGNILEIK